MNIIIDQTLLHFLANSSFQKGAIAKLQFAKAAKLLVPVVSNPSQLISVFTMLFTFNIIVFIAGSKRGKLTSGTYFSMKFSNH